MDDKSIEILEFPRVREILAGFTAFSTSRQLALDLQPLSSYERISLLLKQSAEARRLLSLEPDFSIGGITDVREAVKLAARGKILEPQTLLDIQRTLAATRHLHSNLSRLKNDLPLLWVIASAIMEMRELENAIGACLTPTGEILDTASEKLSTVRRQLREAKEQLLNRFDAIIKSPRGRKLIQEPIITEREGRYVIPVKIELHKEMKGIVHDISNTGATAFIEPWSTVEMGNEVRELVLEERREIERILAELSARIGAYEVEISRNITLAAEIDLALAKARYAQKARATEPILNPFDNLGNSATKYPAGVLKLVDARHPLLSAKAVPLSVEIGRDFSILVITGPNTGGKTVALKTIGLLSLMTQAGMPIPAAPESYIPVFDGIFADIGDEQSIEQTLSTFSWHTGNIVRIIKQSTRQSLVLLDELGTNTDPVEGSSLAHSILLYFLEHKTMTAATTHYSGLKAFAHNTPGLQNASMDFDPVTLAPTYHLTVGIPGGSNALATAARLGLLAEIINRAREMLPEGTRELEILLVDLISEKHKLETLRSEVEKEKKESEQHNIELKNEIQRLKSEERKFIRETRDKISQEAADLHNIIREAESELRKEKTKERIEAAKKSLAAAREQLKSEVWQVKTPEGMPQEERINVGDTVWLREADVRGTVLSIFEETQEVEVQAGAAKLRLSLKGVEKAPPPVTGREAFIPVKREISKQAVPRQLDLRGKRADEVEPLLDSYLDDASLSNWSEVRIIHGFGTGTVRKIVRDFLAAHPLVKSFRSGKRDEGGDGATVVTL